MTYLNLVWTPYHSWVMLIMKSLFETTRVLRSVLIDETVHQLCTEGIFRLPVSYEISGLFLPSLYNILRTAKNVAHMGRDLMGGTTVVPKHEWKSSHKKHYNGVSAASFHTTNRRERVKERVRTDALLSVIANHTQREWAGRWLAELRSPCWEDADIIQLI